MARVRSSWYKFEVKEVLMHYFFARAKLQDTKSLIIVRRDQVIGELETRGLRAFALLYFALAQEGLRRAEFNHSRKDDRDLMEIVREFIKRWDSDPKLRKARALVEMM